MKLDIHSEKLRTAVKNCREVLNKYNKDIKQYTKAFVVTIGFIGVYIAITYAVIGSETTADTRVVPLLSPVITEASTIENNEVATIMSFSTSTMNEIENLVPMEISNEEIGIKIYSERLAQKEYEEATALAYERKLGEENNQVVTEFLSLEEIEVEKAKIESSNEEIEETPMDYGSAEVVYYGALSSEEQADIQKSVEQGRKDANYNGQSVKLTKYNRDLLERLVFGEAGGEGFVGAVLVAQAVRDTMVMNDIYDTAKIIKRYSYSGSTRKGTSDMVKKAVAYVFDEGGYAVKHRVIYFYAPGLCKSSFHESQKFIIEWKGHRFFDEVAVN